MTTQPATRYWKVLDAAGRSCHGGDFTWSLPRWSEARGWVPGEWTPTIVDLEPCVRGYHICRDQDLLSWLGERIYACEVRGPIITLDTKVVASSVRLTCPTPWDDVSARLFAVECAVETLPHWESLHPLNTRPHEALEVAYRHALGDASDAELAAAGLAAWSAESAAGLAAGLAAESAAESAQGELLLSWLGASE